MKAALVALAMTLPFSAQALTSVATLENANCYESQEQRRDFKSKEYTAKIDLSKTAVGEMQVSVAQVSGPSSSSASVINVRTQNTIDGLALTGSRLSSVRRKTQDARVENFTNVTLTATNIRVVKFAREISDYGYEKTTTKNVVDCKLDSVLKKNDLGRIAEEINQ